MWCIGYQFGVCYYYCGGIVVQGQGGYFVVEVIGGDVWQGYVFEGFFVYQVGGFVIDDQCVVDFVVFEYVCCDVYVVDEGQVGVGDVECYVFIVDVQVV